MATIGTYGNGRFWMRSESPDGSDVQTNYFSDATEAAEFALSSDDWKPGAERVHRVRYSRSVRAEIDRLMVAQVS